MQSIAYDVMRWALKASAIAGLDELCALAETCARLSLQPCHSAATRLWGSAPHKTTTMMQIRNTGQDLARCQCCTDARRSHPHRGHLRSNRDSTTGTTGRTRCTATPGLRSHVEAECLRASQVPKLPARHCKASPKKNADLPACSWRGFPERSRLHLTSRPRPAHLKAPPPAKCPFKSSTRFDAGAVLPAPASGHPAQAC